jgi:hypothetical protein
MGSRQAALRAKAWIDLPGSDPAVRFGKPMMPHVPAPL